MPTDARAARRGRALGLVVKLAIAGLALAILAGFFGARIHAFDSAGHFRAHLAALLAIAAMAALLLRHRITAFCGTVVAVLGLATTIPYFWPEPGQRVAAEAARPRYTLLQMNLRYNAAPALAVRRIAESSPDVVTVQEGTSEWRETFETLRDRYPYQFFCDGDSSVGDSGILSRRPFAAGSEGTCIPEAGYTARGIDFNGVPVTIGSVHLDWPWPHKQWSQIEMLETSAFDERRRPRIVAGDFNAAPWSAAVGALAEASGTVPVKGIGPTWIHRMLPTELARLIGLPIDNVLVSAGVEVLRSERLTATASDHLPILVAFTLPFAPPEGPEIRVVAR